MLINQNPNNPFSMTAPVEIKCKTNWFPPILLKNRLHISAACYNILLLGMIKTKILRNIELNWSKMLDSGWDRTIPRAYTCNQSEQRDFWIIWQKKLIRDVGKTWMFGRQNESILAETGSVSSCLGLRLVPIKLNLSPQLDWQLAALCISFKYKAPDPNSGGLKNQYKISQFCA